MSMSNNIDTSPSHTNDLLYTSLAKNKKIIEQALGHSNDIIIREITIGESTPHNIAIISIDGLSDKTTISDSVIDKLMANIEEEQDIEITTINQYVRNSYLTVGDVSNIEHFTTLYNAILNGETVILLDGFAEGIVTSTRSAKDRAVTEPSTESVIRGPRESFTETIRTNTALIRRKIKSPNLWIKSRVIGDVTQTDVAVMYINGIASDKIVAEVLARLDRINIDGILESGYIEDFIQDSKNSMFPTVYNSERPDVIAGELLDGKVAILVDGTPFVLVVPALFTSFLQSAEDYYQHWMISSLVRILRFFGIGLALVAPSLYVAITTFTRKCCQHQC